MNQRFVLQQIEYNQQQTTQNNEETNGLAENCVWMVVKSINNIDGVVGYVMKEGDQIKLGRVRFRIREIKTSDSIQQKNGLQNIISDRDIQFKSLDKQNNDIDDAKSDTSASSKTCRICLGEAEDDNPLIYPCVCLGSVKYIHILCLQKWLGNKLGAKITKFSVSLIWKKFECEICKTEFPNIINHNGIQWETVEIPKPSIPYITLEILSREKNVTKGQNKHLHQPFILIGTHIISLSQKNQIKLGRGHDSDVRITDISVSRLHAIIKFVNGKFYLEDNRSKFGTLVLMQQQTNISVEENNNIAVQIGRSVISIQIKKDWKIGSCCIGGQLSNQDDAPDADDVQQIQQGDIDGILMNKSKQINNDNQIDDEQDIENEQDEEVDNEQQQVQQHSNPNLVQQQDILIQQQQQNSNNIQINNEQQFLININ